jgi:hypothetical protein
MEHSQSNSGLDQCHDCGVRRNQLSNPTSNFGWQMPTNTDLVSQLPADFEVFGQAVDTSLADLKGGTTGQVLKKNTDTDMDFVWAADSAGMTNPMTTTGDTIYSSSGSTPARLGIGTAGQFLKVNAGATAPEWATLSTAPTFVGCRAYASNDQTVANSTNVIIGFNNENFDSNSFHDNSVNNSRMTIPAGYGGKYQVFANLAYNGNTSGNRVVDILLNGSIVATSYSGASTTNAITCTINLAMDLAVADYIQVQTSQDSGGSRTVFGSSTLSPNQAATAFQITYLGA